MPESPAAPDGTDGTDGPPGAAIGQGLAVVVVFTTSAAVLVLEIVAARLLAPFVGDSLRTYTAVIGVVLAGIAAGSWLGGRWADAVDPRRLLGPVVTAGGLLGLLSLPLTTLLGQPLRGTGAVGTVLVTAAAFVGPALLLTAATPLVVKLRLRDLHETGRVVGRLSAVGTAGALAGTFLTGFVLVALLPSRTIVVVVAGGTVLLGLGLTLGLARPGNPRGPARGTAAHGPGGLPVVAAVLAVAGGAVGLGAALGSPCEEETAYYCVAVRTEAAATGGEVSVLVLDSVRHSAVQPADPDYLHFRYTRLFAAVAATRPAGPLDVVHLGAGGLTMPRHLDVVRPGSRHTVLEVDPALEDVARRRLAWTAPASTTVVPGDARVTLRAVPAGSADLVLGDAFGGLAVPWHLTTRELVADVARRLGPEGVYAVNVIDHGPLALARAQTATVAAELEHVVVLTAPDVLRDGGNVVVVGSVVPIDTAALLDAAAAEAERAGFDEETIALEGEALQEWVGDAPVLTDAYAPVDQLLTP